MLKSFQSAPILSKRMTTSEVDAAYSYWRFRLLYATYIGYATFYLTRKNIAFVLPAMMSDLHFTKASVGVMASAFYIIYGISKFVSGIISDKSNPRYFMAFGLFATGIANIIFGFSSSLICLTILWMINAFFQGWGWPPCGRILTRWFSQKERGTWWSIWNTSHNLGGGLVPFIVVFCVGTFGWRYAMILPGIFAILISLFLFNRLCDVPEAEGLPSIEEYKNEDSVSFQSEESQPSIKRVLIDYILKNKFMWILAGSYVLVYVVRTAINDWGTLYLTEKGNGLLSSASAVSFFEIGGIFGSLVAGFGSDKIFHGRRTPVNVIFSLGILVSLYFFWSIPSHFFALNAIFLFLSGFFVFGPQMLIGIAAAEYCHREAAGAATGFISLFGYLGAALSGYPIGYITEHYGWNAFFFILIFCGLGLIGLLATTLKRNKRRSLVF